MKTTTIISVLYKDYGSFDYMIKTALATSDNIEQILICDNGENKKLHNLYNDRVKFVEGVINPHDGSMSHGMGINKLLPMVKTPLLAIIEPDVIVLDRGWDDMPENVDLRAGCKTTYNGISCYLPCFMIGCTDKLQNIDFAPTGAGVPCSATEMFVDTGWRVSVAGLAVEKLIFKRCIDGQCSLIPNNVFSKKTNEFWLGEKPIAAHLWRGSDPEKRGSKYREDFAMWQKTAEEMLQRISK